MTDKTVTQAECLIVNCRSRAPADEAFCAKHRDPKLYAYCCAQGGGNPEHCDCVSKDHGYAR